MAFLLRLTKLTVERGTQVCCGKSFAPNGFCCRSLAVATLEDVAGVSMIDSTFGQLSILSREEILETVEKFLGLFQHASIGMLIATPEGQLLDVNTTFCDFLGYSREELIGKAVQRFVHPEDLAMASQKFDEARSGQHSSPRLEKRYLRKDGTIRWAEVTASTVRDADGEITTVNTEWETFGRENGASEATRTGVGLNYLEVCRQANKMGCLEAGRACRGVEAVLQGRLKSFDLEYPCNSAMGRHWFQMTAVPLASAECGAVIIHREITALKEAEMLARESESRFRQVADAAPVMIWMSGLDKDCTYFNRTWLDFTGQPLATELGDGWTKGVHPDDVAHCFETYAWAFDARQRFEMEYRLRRKDGQYRWIFDIGVPRFSADGEFAGYIGSCVDVTERKQAEEAMASISGRLIEAQEQERHRIARELHDDVGQRLAVISWELEGLQRDLPVDAKGLNERVDRARTGTSQILSSIRALSHELHSWKLDVMGLVAAMESFCMELSEQHHVTIDFVDEHTPAHMPQELSLCLFRVLQEGLHNAVKHSGVSHFEVRVGTKAADELQLTIRDRGAGFSLREATNKTGLGLASMRERVALARGTFSIKSKRNEGTEINVRVPLAV